VTAPAGDTTATDTTADTTGTDTTDSGQQTDGVKLTPEQQAFVDQMFAKRIREEKARLSGEKERAVQEALERSKMDAAERAQAERDEARKQAEEATNSSKRAVAEARVETALLAAGIKQGRIDAVARLVNLDDVMGADDPKTAAADAVRQVLADFPEFKPTPGASGGELGGGNNAASVTLEQFKGMDLEARSALYKKDIGLYRSLAAQEQAA
jgi:hypothetical protein